MIVEESNVELLREGEQGPISSSEKKDEPEEFLYLFKFKRMGVSSDRDQWRWGSAGMF